MKLLIAFLLAVPIQATDVLTAHFDNTRDNWNQQETVLTPSVVKSRLKKLGTWTADGAIFAQPLIATAVTIGGANYTVLVTCTMHDSCYAFDAGNPGAQLWHTSLGTSLTTYPGQADAGGLFYDQEVGCVSTPVIDKSGGFVYAVCTNSTPVWTLYKLNLTTGAVINSVVITTTGFSPAQQLQRASLALSGGNVYIAFASFDDISPWFGWIFSYSASSLAQSAVVNLCPTGNGGGVWNGEPVIDGSGNVIVAAGNGTFDGVSNFGESLVKLSSSLSILDWFTPTNFAALDAVDADLGSGRAMLLPGTNYVLVGSKDFNIYVVNGASMGHTGGASQIVATGNSTVTSDTGIFGGLVGPNGRVYFPNNYGPIYSFTYSGSTLGTSPITTTSTFGPQGAVMSGSSNGPDSGIVWAVTSVSNANTAAQPGILHAFDASTLAELWNSSQVTDTLGTIAKFASPTVVNGQVFVATHDGTIQLYGLGPAANASPAVHTSSCGGTDCFSLCLTCSKRYGLAAR